MKDFLVWLCEPFYLNVFMPWFEKSGFILYGGGSKSPPPPSTQTVTQTTVPSYARPYYEDVMQRAQAESNRPYTPYEGERIAGFTPGQEQAQQEVLGMQTPGQFAPATGFATAAGLGSLQAGQYTPGQFNTLAAQAPNLSMFQMQSPDQFGQAQADQYMSPYMQNVLDVQKRQAIEDAQKTQLATNLGAARQGTYGGARQLLATTQREQALGQQLGDIQATGLQSAYESAQQQFERDRAAGMMAGQQNLGAALGVQELGAQTGMQAQLANQRAMLEAQGMGEQSRQFGGTLGMQGYAQALQSAGMLGDLGAQQQTTDMQRIQAQAAAGAEQRDLRQQQLDTSYADFLRQRDYPMEQLGMYSGMIHGQPIQMGSTATTYAPPPSLASQVGGAGLAGLGLFNMLKD